MSYGTVIETRCPSCGHPLTFIDYRDQPDAGQFVDEEGRELFECARCERDLEGVMP